LQHQIVLGDDAFVEKHPLRQELLAGDVSEIPFKQRCVTALSLKDDQRQSKTRNDAIIKVYKSGSYIIKEIGGYFTIHHSSVSRVVAASKNKIMQNKRPAPRPRLLPHQQKARWMTGAY